MSNIQIDWQAFNIRDLKIGRYKCRYCGGIPEPPKQVYCSDECRRKFEIALSWPYVRKRVWERDDHKCVRCQKEVPLHCIGQTGDELTFSDEIANTHHIIPVAYLWGEIIKAVEGLEGREREYRLEQLKVIVFFHQDNLETLCETCHKEAHRSGWYNKFKMMETGQQTLEIFRN